MSGLSAGWGDEERGPVSGRSRCPRPLMVRVRLVMRDTGHSHNTETSPGTSSGHQDHHHQVITRITEIISSQWWVMVDSVSISITSAIVYGVSGGLFFLLIFLLILIGLCNCNCDNYRCGEYRKTRRSIYAPSVLPTKVWELRAEWWKLRALDRFELNKRKYRDCDSLSSWRSQKKI